MNLYPAVNLFKLAGVICVMLGACIVLVLACAFLSNNEDFDELNRMHE